MPRDNLHPDSFSIMKSALTLAASVALAFLYASPASAQTHDGSAGYGGGFISFGDLNGGSAGESITLEPGWVAIAHAEHWMGSRRVGARLNAAFTRRPLEMVGDTRDINTWIIHGDLLLRILPATRGRTVAPFVAAGVGVVSYGLGKGEEVVLVPEDARYDGDSERRLAVSGGIGFDVIPGFTFWGSDVGFRFEAIDHVALESPFTSLDGSELDPVHNLRVSLSVLGLVDFLEH